MINRAPRPTITVAEVVYKRLLLGKIDITNEIEIMAVNGIKKTKASNDERPGLSRYMYASCGHVYAVESTPVEEWGVCSC